jgi:hypothetical protein
MDELTDYIHGSKIEDLPFYARRYKKLLEIPKKYWPTDSGPLVCQFFYRISFEQELK